jgi:hypothetical protein
MLKRLFALALAALAFAAPAAAQDMWRHAESGISLPRRIGEMRLQNESDASGGRRQDVALQLGTGDTAVTLYIYRAAYPNPALWFERTRLAMTMNVGAPADRVAPNSFTLGNASAPNGLREDIAITGGRARATSVAMAQAGEWIVKLRVTSASLDVAGVGQRMDALLGALRFERMPAPHPLVVPGPCPDETPMRGRPIREVTTEAVAAGTVNGIIAMGQARGHSGLAANPSEWCRMETRMPAMMGAVYRRRNGSEWVALVTDAGRAVAGMRLEVRDAAVAATYATVPGTTSLIALYDELPDPDSAIGPAVPVIMGEGRGLTEISTDEPRGQSQRQRRNRRKN